MRHFLTFIGVIFLAVFCCKAQNANRSGVFFEGTLGAVMGNRPVTNLDERDDIFQTVDKLPEANAFYIDTKRESKASYGFGFNVAAGYRWAVSRLFAVELKAKYQDATYRFKETSQLDVMAGLRYFPIEFGVNKSLYINVGVGGGIFVDQSKFALPYEVGAGINFTNQLYAGLAWDAQYSFADKFIYGKHYGIAGAKIGFRL